MTLRLQKYFDLNFWWEIVECFLRSPFAALIAHIFFWNFFSALLSLVITAISIVNFSFSRAFIYTQRSINLSSIFVQLFMNWHFSQEQTNKRRRARRIRREKMIKWKKQCEFCNKNLRMKTKIEAITNKRSERRKMWKYARNKRKKRY